MRFAIRTIVAAFIIAGCDAKTKDVAAKFGISAKADTMTVTVSSVDAVFYRGKSYPVQKEELRRISNGTLYNTQYRYYNGRRWVSCGSAKDDSYARICRIRIGIHTGSYRREEDRNDRN